MIALLGTCRNTQSLCLPSKLHKKAGITKELFREESPTASDEKEDNRESRFSDDALDVFPSNKVMILIQCLHYMTLDLCYIQTHMMYVHYHIYTHYLYDVCGVNRKILICSYHVHLPYK